MTRMDLSGKAAIEFTHDWNNNGGVWSIAIKVHIRKIVFSTVLANTMAEFRIRMVLNVCLDLIPVSFVIPIFFRMGTNREQSTELFNLLQTFFKIQNHFFSFFLCDYPFGYIVNDCK